MASDVFVKTCTIWFTIAISQMLIHVSIFIAMVKLSPSGKKKKLKKKKKKRNKTPHIDSDEHQLLLVITFMKF